jgi:hypothetical protein
MDFREISLNASRWHQVKGWKIISEGSEKSVAASDILPLKYIAGVSQRDRDGDVYRATHRHMGREIKNSYRKMTDQICSSGNDPSMCSDDAQFESPTTLIVLTAGSLLLFS